MVAPVAGKSGGYIEDHVILGLGFGTGLLHLIEIICGGGRGANEDGGGGHHQVGFGDYQRRQNVIERRQPADLGVVVGTDFVSVDVLRRPVTDDGIVVAGDWR